VFRSKRQRVNSARDRINGVPTDRCVRFRLRTSNSATIGGPLADVYFAPTASSTIRRPRMDTNESPSAHRESVFHFRRDITRICPVAVPRYFRIADLKPLRACQIRLGLRISVDNERARTEFQRVYIYIYNDFGPPARPREFTTKYVGYIYITDVYIAFNGIDKSLRRRVPKPLEVSQTFAVYIQIVNCNA